MKCASLFCATSGHQTFNKDEKEQDNQYFSLISISSKTPLRSDCFFQLHIWLIIMQRFDLRGLSARRKSWRLKLCRGVTEQGQTGFGGWSTELRVSWQAILWNTRLREAFSVSVPLSGISWTTDCNDCLTCLSALCLLVLRPLCEAALILIGLSRWNKVNKQLPHCLVQGSLKSQWREKTSHCDFLWLFSILLSLVNHFFSWVSHYFTQFAALF